MKDCEKKLAKKFIEIKKRDWFNTERNSSDRCLGNTFEDEIGVKENNVPSADYYGIEIKTHRPDSNSMISLFSRTPSPKRINTHLRETYGVYNEESGKKILYTTVYGNKWSKHRSGYSFKLEIDEKNEKILLKIKNSKNEMIDDNVYWSFSVIEKALKIKLNKIALIYGEEKNENNEHKVRYTDMFVLEGISLNKVKTCIESGKLNVDIRIGVSKTGKNIGKTHDHGTCFRIMEADLPFLYETKRTYKQIIENRVRL